MNKTETLVILYLSHLEIIALRFVILNTLYALNIFCFVTIFLPNLIFAWFETYIKKLIVKKVL